MLIRTSPPSFSHQGSPLVIPLLHRHGPCRCLSGILRPPLHLPPPEIDLVSPGTRPAPTIVVVPLPNFTADVVPLFFHHRLSPPRSVHFSRPYHHPSIGDAGVKIRGWGYTAADGDNDRGRRRESMAAAAIHAGR